VSAACADQRDNVVGMTAAVARPAAEPDPVSDPESPYQSLRARVIIFAVAGGLSLFLAVFTEKSVLTGMHGYPWGLRAADVACGLAGYAALWWRRRWPLAFAGYILVISVFSTLAGGLAFVAAFTVAVHRNWPTALVTSALLTLAAWPSMILYSDGGSLKIGEGMLVVGVLMLAVTGWGMFIRARRQLLASLRGRAERAERSREEHARPPAVIAQPAGRRAGGDPGVRRGQRRHRGRRRHQGHHPPGPAGAALDRPGAARG
jgi:hypothetical protein